jgi:zinc protease
MVTLPPIPRSVPFDLVALANGLTVILHPDGSAPLAAVVVMYHVGSKNEQPGRTGFAHLFEHLMFKGSAHVADGDHFRLLQEVGASVNGSTSEDRTNYFEVVPSNHLELALFLEADRMGALLPSLTVEKLENQKEVVKNERRQNYDNRPYGRVSEILSAALYPPLHPYHWPVIGSIEDITAASLGEVETFFRKFYTPANACLAIAGDFDTHRTMGWIESFFGSFPAADAVPQPQAQAVVIANEERLAVEDRVALPRLTMAWPGASINTHDDAVLDLLTTILSVGRNSRLHRSLVYRDEIAQSIVAYHDCMELAGTLVIEATAKPDRTLGTIQEAIDRELLSIAIHGITDDEMQGALNFTEMHHLNERVTALQKANGLATFFTLTGDAGNFSRHFARYNGVSAEEIRQRARELVRAPRVLLSVVPAGKGSLALPGSHREIP